MIIEGLLSLLLAVFRVLTLPISIPFMPDTVKTFLATALDYMTSGAVFIAQFFDMEYLLTLFSLVIIVEVGIALYHGVMWLIKKIPMLDIK